MSIRRPPRQSTDGLQDRKWKEQAFYDANRPVGATGAMGPPGPQGLTGPVGPTGPQGPQGIQGPATVTVGTTTTVSSGSPASVTNGGDSTNVVLNFTIPEGQSGTSASLSSIVTYTNAAANGLTATADMYAGVLIDNSGEVVSV